jgi:hypothetical protein
MTVATISNKLFSFCYCIFKVCSFVHCKYRREFFVSKFFCNFNRFNFTDKDFCAFSNFNTCKLCNFVSWLTNDFCI